MVMFRGIRLRGEFLRQVPQTAGLHMMVMISMVMVMSVLLERVTVVVLWCCCCVKGVLSYRVSMQQEGWF